MMDDAGGIIFYRTKKLEEISHYYQNVIGMELWLDQGACRIFRHNNLLLGFCRCSEACDNGGFVTLFFETKEMVDALYGAFRGVAMAPPKENNTYRIYHFFMEDPEGRKVEIQHFMHPIDWPF